MIFKGRAHTENGKYSDLALGIAYSPNIEGPYTVLNNEQPIFQMDGQGEAEDPFYGKTLKGITPSLKTTWPNIRAKETAESWLTRPMVFIGP